MTQKYRPFTDTLNEIRGGAALDQLGRELNKLVAAVVETGGSGELTLKIKVAPLSKKHERGSPAIKLIDDIVVKMPKVDAGGSIFFATVDNNLSRYDPAQQKLPLRAVDDGTNVGDIGAGAPARASGDGG